MADDVTTTKPGHSDPQPVEVHTDEGGHGTKAVVAALFANAAIAVAKFVGFAVTGSSSMLAEAVHSVADSGNQGLLLLGGRRAKKGADEAHPFGYGRERYFWGFVVALVLFSLGSMFAIYEGLHKLDHPEEISSPEWALGILGFAIIAEAFSFRTAINETQKVKGDATYWQFVRRAKSPELPVVLFEDLGAMVGLVLAFAGVTTAVVTEDGKWDAYGTLSIGVLLGIIAIILVIEMKGLLIGESAPRKRVEGIRAAVEIEPEVIRLLHMRTQHLGPEELLVGAKIEFLHNLSVVEVAEVINRIETNIRTVAPEARVIYLEPDVLDEHRATSGVVSEHAGHIDRHDPDYATITGQHKAVDTEDDIWS
ncbi:MAG: cation diffusion facilitator family transporter [Acidimicrobiia bacterium]|nr:cation diffusion facilitator family transporter [Acidimicrobiia bacterium]